MNEQPPMDAEVMPESQAVTVRNPATPPPKSATAVTAQQARIDAVAELTKTALAQAGTLKLTTEETQALMADFADEDFRPGAAGKENLIYIEHAALRDRMNQVLGLGQWAIIVRETWNEDFKTQARPGKSAMDGVRVYARAMLLVRGAYVGEAVGDMDYYPHNASQNYGDAFEGAKTAAFRRCAKEFGVGLQAWRKEWCESWWDRKREASKPGYNAQRAAVSSKPVQRTNAPQGSAQAQEASNPAGVAAAAAELAEKWKQYALSQIKKFHVEQFAYALAIEASWVIPGVDKLEDISPQKFPQTKDAFSDWWNQVKGRKQKAIDEGGMPQDITEAFDKAYLALPFDAPQKKAPPAPPNQARSVPPPEKAPINVPRDTNDPNHPNAPWRSFPMPYGKNAGTQLAKLPKNYLFGLWANFEVSTEYNGRPKSESSIAKDEQFRAMLDEAGAHYEFSKPDGDGEPQEQEPEKFQDDSDIPF